MKTNSTAIRPLLVSLLVLVGCGSHSRTGETAGTVSSRDGGSSGGGGGSTMLRVFTPPPADLGGGAVLLTASGEALALSGFAFPPASANDTFMVDGWNFKLDRYLTVFDKIVLTDSPDVVPTDQSMAGAVVAELDGPWVIDLAKGGPILGKGGGAERALAFGAITGPANGGTFRTTSPYGFGFSTVAATYEAINVNLDAAGLADYDFMVATGYSVLYVGTATFVGTSCRQLGMAAGSTAAYDFSALPSAMRFRLGFNTPVDYVNCQNGTDLAGPGANGEDHPRGIQFKRNASITAQVTIHMDHPFWESFAENSPLHWDQIAAQYVGVTDPEAHTEDLKGVNFTAFSDRRGTPLPWRSCVAAGLYTAPNMGQMGFNPLTVPVNPAAIDPAAALRDYYDFIRFTQSTQGHLNSQGLCFVRRRYPSPPGGS